MTDQVNRLDLLGRLEGLLILARVKRRLDPFIRNHSNSSNSGLLFKRNKGLKVWGVKEP